MGKKYIIFNVSEIQLINFSEVCEDSEDTLRFSIDGTKTIVHWASENTPSFVENLTTKEGIYDHSQMMNIVCTNEWLAPPSYS